MNFLVIKLFGTTIEHQAQFFNTLNAIQSELGVFTLEAVEGKLEAVLDDATEENLFLAEKIIEDTLTRASVHLVSVNEEEG